MSQQQWTAVEDYITEALHQPDDVLDAALAASVQGARRLIETISGEPLVSATIVQTVGAKGYDGFAIAVVQ